MRKSIYSVLEGLERYKYCLVYGTSWIFVALVFGSFNSLIPILSSHHLHALIPLLPLLAFAVSYIAISVLEREIGVRKDEKAYIIWLCIAISFLLFYAVIPLLARVKSRFYFSSIWFLALSLGLILSYIFFERKREEIAFKGSLFSGASGVAVYLVVLLFSSNISPADVMLILNSAMMLLYFISGFVTLLSSWRVLKVEQDTV